MLLEQFFYPEGWGGAEITRDLAVHFARLGCRVEVVCGSEQYAPLEDDPGPDPRDEGLIIRRIPALPGDRNVHSRKALRHLWFCLWSAALLLCRKPPDVFIAQTNPAPAVVLVAFAAAFWRKPFLLIAMDVYPEILFASGMSTPRSLLARLVKELFDRAYRSATCLVALGPAMAERIRAKGVSGARIVQIGNWATGPKELVRGSANPFRTEQGLGDACVLLYSGNLGVGHEFETLLRGFSLALEQIPSLRLIFVGKGARLAETQERVRQLRLSASVTFAPLVPAHGLPETMGVADLGVVTLRQGFEGLMVPSKLAAYMGRGIPALYVGPPGDLEVLISRHACGYSIRNGDPEGVAAAIVDAARHPGRLVEMGRSALRAYDAELNRELGLSRYADAIRTCLATGRRGSIDGV